MIQPVAPADLPALFVYLDDHLQDNGRAGTPLFQPMARADSRFPVDKRAAFAIGLGAEIGAPGWRRAWMALDADGAICGHADLRVGLRQGHVLRGQRHQVTHRLRDRRVRLFDRKRNPRHAGGQRRHIEAFFRSRETDRAGGSALLEVSQCL